jgi:uncharacterized protein YcbX
MVSLRKIQVQMISQDMSSPHLVDELRFKPNIVVSGANSHDEDNWQRVDICSQFGVRPSQPLFPLIYVNID